MIPANLKYQSKVESAPARRYLTQIQPQGGTGVYNPGDTITINIPTRNNTALIPSESYLRGQINLTVSGATGATTLESCGWHAFIQRIRVFHGSNLLEDIDNFSQLAKIFYDFQAPEDAVKGRFSITSGTNADYSVLQGAAAGDILNAASINRGLALGSLGAATHAFPFAINLISMVGALAGDKYLPLWEMTAAPLRVEIVLQSSVLRCLATVNNTITAFTASAVNYAGEFLELPDSAVAAIKSGSSSPMQMVLPSFRSYTNSALVADNTQIQVSFPIPAKFSSLKSLMVVSRTTAGAQARFPLAHVAVGVGTVNATTGAPVTSGYQFRVGSEVLPSTAPVTAEEIYNEAIKCFGSIADMQLQPSVTKSAFTQNLPVTVTAANSSTTDSGAFLIGIDMEIYQNADKSSIFAGTNTNTSDIFAIINYFQNSGAAVTVLQTAFASFDQVLVYENGVCYARY
jgi:hypothetical protein